MLNPRDIAFVVDLSGSMNDDTEPCWSTSLVNSKYAAQGYGTIGNQLMQAVYDDFGFGSFPGTSQYIGAPLGVTANNLAYAELTKDNGPLTNSALDAHYRIGNTDPESLRKTKCYRWIIDKQIAVVMPTPSPRRTPPATTPIGRSISTS